MLQLVKDVPDVGLAVSLHAPTQDIRLKIVPTSKAWSIPKILEAADKFINNQNKNASLNRRRHVLIEYVMIQGINDTIEVAHLLGKLLEGREVLLNLIPYNITAVPHDYKPPTEADKAAFVDVVRRVYKVHTILRQTMGDDIDSACGQLVISNSNLAKKGGCGDLEDMFDTDTRIRKGGVTKKSSKRDKIVAVEVNQIDGRYFILLAILALLSVIVYRNM